ncbi:hypothetical protein [Campylobacter lanienae]|uniref:hypothetical protein n=1 Tax=Campylobacter lanienae TaxID=75658 RepID=UPI000BB3F989|nr:hypothetical protein [Campylobacter lanienae]
MEKLVESLGVVGFILFCCVVSSLMSFLNDTFFSLAVSICLSLCLLFFVFKHSTVKFPKNATKNEMIEAGEKHFKHALKHAYIIWILFLIKIFYLVFAYDMRHSYIEIATAIAFSVSVGFVYFESRNIGSPCKKCELYNSYVLINKERLTQSKITERKEVNRNGRTRYEYTDYIVGKDRLLYQCQKCGEQYTITKSYKEKP